MTAVWLRARSELRAGARSLVALALLLGVIGGAVLTAAEGARRTDTAYARFLDTIDSPDAFVLGGSPEGPLPAVDVHHVLELPQVVGGASGPGLFGQVQSEQGDTLWNGDLNLQGAPTRALYDRYGYGARLLGGRFPDPDNPHEVAVGYRRQPDPRIGIGDSVRIALVKPGVDPFTVFGANLSDKQLLPPVTVRIVGTVLVQGELQGSHDILMTPAFFETYGPKAFTLPIAVVKLKNGFADFPAFTEAVDRMTPGALVFSNEDEALFVERSTHVLAISLWLFAGIAALAGLIIFGQALARNTFEESRESAELWAVGMTRPQLFGLGMLRATVVAVLGGAAAIVIAFLLSPLTPIGRLARVAEPHPGFSFDTELLLAGAVGLVLLVLAFAALPAWRAARPEGGRLGSSERSGAARPSAVADGFARAGLPPAAVTGVRMALQPGKGRSATPVRATVIGAALSIAALTTAFTFGSSFQHLFDTPRLYGENWDLIAGNPYLNQEQSEKVQKVLESEAAIRSISKADIREFLELGPAAHPVRVNAFGFQSVTGSIGPSIVEGRKPVSDNEIALGGKTMRSIGASIGDRIEVRKGARSEVMTVVGRAVLPVGFGPGLAEGAALTFPALKHFVPHAVANGFAFNLAPGINQKAVAGRLDAKLGRYSAGTDVPAEGEDLGNLRRVDNMPFLLAAILGLAAAGTLAHTLAASVRRRRRDLAILKTLGFVRRQVSGAVAWQATAIGVLALAVGIPLGVAAGRWSWNIFAEQIGVVPEPVTPVVVAILVIPAMLLFANLVAALPARAAGRTQPAVVLRTE